MTTREAARPLRRYMRARVRAASLAPTYTITRDVTFSPFGTCGKFQASTGTQRGPSMRNMRVETNHATRAAATAAVATAAVLYNVES